jgi:hypothetical protein
VIFIDDTRTRGPISFLGTASDKPFAFTRMRNPTQADTKQTIRKVHGGISVSAIFMKGQFRPQHKVRAPRRMNPSEGRLSPDELPPRDERTSKKTQQGRAHPPSR